MEQIDSTTTFEPSPRAAKVGEESEPKVKAIEDLLRLVARLIATRHLRDNVVTRLSTCTRRDHHEKSSYGRT